MYIISPDRPILYINICIWPIYTYAGYKRSLTVQSKIAHIYIPIKHAT